jgi:FtsP/CotA-like multicopper oxidase with cupredoxin domain
MSRHWLPTVLVIASLGGVGSCARQGTDASSPITRTYYIAADDVIWDYAPSGINRITGKPFNDEAAFWVVRAADRLGRVFKKTIFREYTDATFTSRTPRPSEWEHLGMLGPLLRAEVGETIRVVFKNNGQHPFSMHPHGVFYTKDSEGAQYDDGTGSQRGGVPPGGTHTYVWPVPERAGPAPGEGSSIFWMYHSHIDEERDVNAGLVGPIIVTARRASKPDGTPKDVDREFVAGFVEVDENLSWHFDENIRTYAEKPEQFTRSDNFADPLYISNLKETINGFLFGHMPNPTMRTGERVRWYLFATTNFEIHTPHWHGNTVVARHMRTDVVGVLPMDMVAADMIPDNPGTWLFHCHTGPHLRAGMQAKYVVLEGSGAYSSGPPDEKH